MTGYMETYFGHHKGKVYVYLGEFHHAPGHCLLCEFGNEWKFTGMHETNNLEFLDQHPDDVVIHLEIDDSDD